MIAYAFTLPRAPSAALLLQPWFAVLVASTAVDRLACVSLGVIAERDFVVQVSKISLIFQDHISDKYVRDCG